MAHLYYSIAPEVVAFSTRRSGGVSQGNYATFNVNPFCGDRQEHVEQNLGMLAEELGLPPGHVVIPRQVHGTEVALVEGPCSPDGVDALVTQVPGLCVGVSTADCIPLLLYDPVHQAVAAIHAGWRGTVADIAGRTLRFMKQHVGTSASDVKAVLGPGIGLQAFEVGDEVYDAFRQAGFPMLDLALRKDKWHINLPEANAWLLKRQGVHQEQIHFSGICTSLRHQEFFSARRLGIRSGRILNGIYIKESQR